MATRKKPDEAQPTPEIEQPPEQPFTPIDAPVERPAARENSNARRTSNGGNKPGGGKDSGGKKALVGGGGHSGATHRPSPKKKAKKHAVKQDIIEVYKHATSKARRKSVPRKHRISKGF
jgi:hypothetical protein